MGNKNAPIGDDDIAASITLTGQAVIKAARTYGREFAQQVIGHNNFEDIAVAGDTDSAYFSIAPLLAARNIKLIDDGKVTDGAHQVIEQLNEYLNNNIKEWMKSTLNSYDPRIEFKREAIIDRGLFLEKKRYVAHVVDDEGIECDKWKYVGVDVVRTTMPKAIKPYVKKIIETMLVTQNRKSANDVVNEAYQVFKSLKPEELAYTSGMSDYSKYASKSKEMNMPKGTPVHVKAAHGYNTLIKKLNIENKYEMLQSGDKVRWMYVKHPNKYNMQSIAFKYYYPQELAETFEPDYEKMFEKIVFSVVERFYAAVKWSAHKPNEQMKCDLLDLFG